MIFSIIINCQVYKAIHLEDYAKCEQYVVSYLPHGIHEVYTVFVDCYWLPICIAFQKSEHLKCVCIDEWLQLWLLILSDILFTNETWFTCDSSNNTRNSHSGVEQDAHSMVKGAFQWIFANIGFAILGNYLLVPYFERHSTTTYYENFL
jgi:hypothetical protein